MPRGPKLDQELLFNALLAFLRHGPSSPKKITQELGISQATFSRLLSRASSKILIAGKAQKTLYALKREIDEVGEEIKVYTIAETGKSTFAGTLCAIHPHGFYWLDRKPEGSGFFPDLPYFLEDLRPSGFLGRMLSRQHPELSLAPDPNSWSTDQCLRYLTAFGWNLIGNQVLGEKSFQLYLEKQKEVSAALPNSQRAKRYAHMADDVLQLGDAGSSAGGERAKFLAANGTAHSIVKFSPRERSSVNERRADLLICEYLAKEVLQKYGWAVSQSELLFADDRTLLEIARFDRVEARGRRGVISLRALDLEFVGKGAGWSQVARELYRQKKIGAPLLKKIEWLETFGDLIANSDMHSGNLSFFTDGEKIVDLTPVYDMLPMLYHPREEVVARLFKPKQPTPESAATWGSALPAAIAFWKKVAAHPKISKSFKKIAKENYAVLERSRELLELLPT